MSRNRPRRLVRWLLETTVMVIIVFLYFIVLSRGQIVHGRIM